MSAVRARSAASASASGPAERPESINRQPSAANALAVARPIPRLEPVISTTLPASFRSMRLSLRLAFGDPGLHLVVVVGEIILGDVVAGGRPDAVMPEDVAQRLVEMLGRVRPADIVRVQRKTHDTPVLGALAVESVKLVLDHLLEVIRLPVPGEHPGVVGLAGIGEEDEFLAAAYVDRPGLVGHDPRRVIEAASLGHQIVCSDRVACPAAEPSLQTFSGHLLQVRDEVLPVR